MNKQRNILVFKFEYSSNLNLFIENVFVPDSHTTVYDYLLLSLIDILFDIYFRMY